jgi:biotin carboxylase
VEILLIDAPGGPQPEALADILMPFRPVRIISVPWGSAELRAARLTALSRLGPVELVDRPDQVVEAGLASAALHDFGGVVALSEIVSFYAGLLANLLGLPGNPPAALLAVRHKNHQRRLLAQGDVPSATARTVNSEADLVDCTDLRFPVILKPSTGVGSLCVFRVADPAELNRAYADALRRYRADPRPNGSAPVFLVEEEIHGTNWHGDPQFGNQVSVESLVHRGVVHHLGVTDKLPLAPPFREFGHVTPSLLTDERIRRVEDVAGDAIRVLGLTTGAVHTELMLTADGPVVLEVNGRLGGGVYELMRFSRGYDVVRAIVDTACGRDPILPDEPSRYAAFVKPQTSEGVFRVAAIDKASMNQAMEGAEWGVLDKTEGAILDSENGTNSNLARFVVTAADQKELFEKIDTVEGGIRSAVTLESAR